MTITKYACDQPQSLVGATKDLLRADERSIGQISMEARIPYFWLLSFSQGKIAHPGVNRIQHLYEFLTGKKLIEG